MNVVIVFLYLGNEKRYTATRCSILTEFRDSRYTVIALECNSIEDLVIEIARCIENTGTVPRVSTLDGSIVPANELENHLRRHGVDVPAYTSLCIFVVDETRFRNLLKELGGMIRKLHILPRKRIACIVLSKPIGIDVFIRNGAFILSPKKIPPIKV